MARQVKEAAASSILRAAGALTPDGESVITGGAITEGVISALKAALQRMHDTLNEQRCLSLKSAPRAVAKVRWLPPLTHSLRATRTRHALRASLITSVVSPSISLDLPRISLDLPIDLPRPPTRAGAACGRLHRAALRRRARHRAALDRGRLPLPAAPSRAARRRRQGARHGCRHGAAMGAAVGAMAGACPRGWSGPGAA